MGDESVRQRYEALAATGALQPDSVQRSLADALDVVVTALRQRPRRANKGLFGWRARRNATPARCGLYIWGGVGRGKTLLMDLFFAAAATKRKRRVHFHQFMGDVHDRMNVFRRKLKSGEVSGDDPIVPVANAIAADVELLCFDEFAVFDIADAMILGRLFEQLFALGVTVVATSNVAPDDLYEGGLNRPLFLPFIALLKKHMRVFHLDAPHDYRLGGDDSEPRYVVPPGARADACLRVHFNALSGREHGERQEILFKRRTIVVPEAADGVAWFSFADLCSRPLSARDYLAIADAFHTIIVAGIPCLQPERRNEVKRLINLIDTLYDRRRRLVVSAEAEPDLLWQGRDDAETFEFARTASRLTEMRSDAYWETAGPAAATKKARAS